MGKSKISPCKKFCKFSFNLRSDVAVYFTAEILPSNASKVIRFEVSSDVPLELPYDLSVNLL
jgi:hypothetical protein